MAKSRKRETKKVKPSAVTSELLKAGITVARKTGARALFVYGDVPINLEMIHEKKPSCAVVLVSADPQLITRGGQLFSHTLQLPPSPLSRVAQIKVSIIMAISAKIINPMDRIVFLTGGPGKEALDAVVVFEVGQEFALLASPEMPKFPDGVAHGIFEQLMRLAIGIANEGREGRPVGTIFVLGDTREVLKHVEQMIINPFKGHREERRQILNPGVQETIKEMAQLDGAFIIRPNGVIETAGAYISAKMVPSALPQGLGTRHYSAAAITAATNALAITISQSTGDVYIFKNGKIVTCIEKNPQ